MKSKFEFRPVNRTFSDPVAAQFKPGTPFGREYSRGDVVLLHPEISSSKIYLNSNVLRDAMLTSKEYLEEALGLIISDATNIEEVKEEAPKKETKPKKTSKKEVPEVTEVVIEGVNEVPEGEEVKEEVVIDAPVEVAEAVADSLILEEEPLVTEE
jgi:hypothetical protein